MISAAIVGLGWWGKKLSQVIAGSSALKIVRGVEPNAAALEGFNPGFPVSGDFDAALADKSVQAVILATPHTMHDAQIEKAVAAGKHVFCEKPLSLTAAGAALSVKRCAEKKLVLGMGHERRFEPPVVELMRDARAGVFGTLMQLEGNFSHDKFTALAAGNWRLSSEHAPAGGMTATGIHLLDIATALFGPAQDVSVASATLASNITNGDTSCALVRYKSGATAYVSTMMATPFISRIAVFGRDGWMEIRDKAHVENPQGWIVTRCKKGGEPTMTEVKPTEAVRANLEAFAAACEGKAAYPITGEELQRNIAVMEAIFKSAKSGKMEAVA